MKYRIHHITKYSYTDPVPVCHNLTHLAPRELPNQTCNRFQLLVNPVPSDRSRRTDAFGNWVDYFSIQDPHRGLTVTASSEIETTKRVVPTLDVAADQSISWPDVVAQVKSDRSEIYVDAYQYVFSSRYAQRNVKFAEYAQESFTDKRDITDAAMDLTTRIFEQFEYNPRATTISTPVDQVFEQKAGVCQDFAHFQIACLRSLGIPARYVSGYLRTIPPKGSERLIGADATHAWVSVFCGQAGWIDFDPTNNVIPSTDHITIGWGRDYQDVCPVQGVFIGGGRHSLSISVDVQPLDV